MKKITSLLLAVVFVFLVAIPAFANESLHEGDSEIFSYYNNQREIVTVVIVRTDAAATSKVYIDGVLTQESTANAITRTIDTKIYDLSASSQKRAEAIRGTSNGFETSVIHAPVSNEKISTAYVGVQSRSVDDEPVDNTGLFSSGYGDGYYFLGAAKYDVAPEVYGYLYRTYTKTDDGPTKYWRWGLGETISAISAAVSLFGGPVSAVLSILAFTATQVLAYEQALELETNTFDYHYKVNVYGEVHFTAQRNITYWKIGNTTAGTVKWEEKSFNYGYTMANWQMIYSAVNNYLMSIR